MINASFYNISYKIDPDYRFNGSVSLDYDTFLDIIKDYLNENDYIKSGDVLFAGSTYETRQEYGFFLVLENNNLVAAENIVNTIIDNHEKLPININYKNLIDDLKKNDEHIYSLFFGGSWYNDEDINDCINALKEVNLFYV
jgi:hypothetical protein